MPSEASTPIVDTDDDEPIPSANMDALIQSLDVTPLRILPPSRQPSDVQGTPGGYTGSSAGATQDVAPAIVSGVDPFSTPGGCSTSVSPRPSSVPKMETLDLLDQRSRPSLDLFRSTRRRMKKTPYVEQPPGAIIEVSDEDEGDMDIMSELGVDYDKNKRVKEETLTVAELNSKFEQKMKEEMSAVQEESARKLARLQDELRASAAKTDAIFEMLRSMQSQAPPVHQHYSYPPQGYPLQPPPLGMYQAGPSHPPVPHPTPAGSPLPPEVATSSAPTHDAVSAAIREDEDLRTRVRESSGSAALTPPPSRVGLPSTSGRVVGSRGDDTAAHTDVLIVEATQGSPNDVAMDVESPEQAHHASARMEDVRMETLDLGGDEDESDRIQQTQASQAAQAPVAMEAEAAAPMEVTNARSLIEEEGSARSSDAAPPPDDEVNSL